MSIAGVVVVVAACVACTGAVVAVVAAGILIGQVRRLERGIEALRAEAVPLVSEARRAAEGAASRMERLDAALVDTGSVPAAVDSPAVFTQLALASPMVKVLAWRAGLAGALARLASPDDPVARTSPRRRHRSESAAVPPNPGPRHAAADRWPTRGRAAGRGRVRQPVAGRR